MSKYKHFNKRAFLVLLCGISIQIAGWFGEHCVEIPFVLKVVAPAYYHARKGLDKLINDNSLNSSDDGFKELAPFALNYIRMQNDVLTSLNDLKVTKLNLATKFSPDGKAKIAASIVVVFVSAPKVKFVGNNFETMQLDRLKDDAESLREPNVIILSFSLFFLGTVFAVLSFFIEDREPVPQVENTYREQAAKPDEQKEEKKICSNTHNCISEDVT